MASRGTRLQFSIAVVLVSVLPLLIFAYLSVREEWSLTVRSGVSDIILLISTALVGMGFLMLVKYPLTIIRIRKYLEEFVHGDLPISVHLTVPENDIMAIETCMNEVLVRLKEKVAEMEHEELRLRTQLSRAQKMESMGALAAGIAHEINTPIQFVGDNIEFLGQAIEDYRRLLDAYRQLLKEAEAGSVSQHTVDHIADMEKSIDLSFLDKEAPGAIAQSREGLAHIATITRAIREYAHMNVEDTKSETDVNEAIQSAVTLSRNEWKYVADMELDLDEKLPLIMCYPGDIKQVLINLIVNAAHAVGEVVGDGSRGKGRILITTRAEDDGLLLSISDTGPGIPAAIRDRIFDHFFTTKGKGKGSGQGLAITRELIVNKHHGAVTFTTRKGRGTTFEIRLPRDEHG